MNPEFKKYCWLELSWTRLAVMVVVLGILFYMNKVLNIHIAITKPLTCFLVLVILWGTRQVSQAMSDELIQHTWDRQRMSAMRAWGFVWGKVIGSAVYTWIGGIICLTTYLAFHLDHLAQAIITVATLTIAGLAGQTLSLLLNLQAMQVTRQVTRTQSFGYFVLGAVLAMELSWGISVNTHYGAPVQWYQWFFRNGTASLIIAGFCLFGVAIGAYRLMRLELQHRNTLWVWPLFVIATLLFQAGFVHAKQFSQSTVPLFKTLMPVITTDTGMHTLVALGLAILYTYIAIFFGNKTLSRWCQWQHAWQNKDVKSAWSALPLWLPTYVICWVVGLILIAVNPQPMFWDVAVVLLFLLRDVSLFMVLNIGSANAHRTDWATLFYLVFSYWAIGGILLHLQQQQLAQLFVPLVNHQQLPLQAGIILIEIAALAGWGRSRWYRLKKSQQN
jgi:hypothetical protein